MNCNLNCPCCDQGYLRQLRDCYFAPARDEEYPSAEYRTAALMAMLLLWYMPSIRLLARTYDRQEIRSALLFRMTPYHLDRALEVFGRQHELKSVPQLAEMIFATLLYDDVLTEHQYEQDEGGGAG